jgi:hypothetical protein
MRAVPLILALLGLALAGAGEALSLPAQSAFTVPLYTAGIVLFAVAARKGLDPLGRPAANDAISVRVTPIRWAVFACGVVVAVALCGLGIRELSLNLSAPAGGLLWLSSMAVLVITATAARSFGVFSPRWAADALPQSPSARQLFWVVLICILILAGLTRFLFLDRVPLGINPDEGDRAALAIALARNQVQRSIFDSGWYFISNLYFTLMAQFFKLVGVGYIQARAFTGIASMLATVAIAAIGTRNFGWRVGLIATGLFATMGVALQFARETSEAGQTAALFAISLACMLEAARRGSPLMWVLTGVTGAFSIYFYPTGRLWAVAAAIACIYLLAHGLGKQRVATLRGIALAAIAALIVASPFFVNIARRPAEFALRAQETSIFANNNAARLPYFERDWSVVRLLQEQVVRTVGIVNRFADRNGFWPTEQPLFPGLLAVLVLVGAGWCAMRWRDPRAFILSTWLLVGLSGSVVTVETPNLQRITTAVPIFALLAAITLDAILRRAHQALAFDGIAGLRARQAATGLIALVALGLMVKEARYYFVDYAAMDRYIFGTAEGATVNAQGTDTLTMTVGRFYFFINSGWVRLLAPDTPRAGLKTPGSDLPLAIPPDRNQAFMLYSRQPFYLPYLQEVVPGGVTITTTHPTQGDLLTVYRVSQQQLARLQGALAILPSGATTPVAGIGEPPRGWTRFPADLTWRAGLRVPRFASYNFRIGPGPARLMIGGTEVMNIPESSGVVSSTVTLARGDQAIEFEGRLANDGTPALFEWAEVRAGQELKWQRPRAQSLFSTQTDTVGLFGTVRMDGKPDQLRIDQAIASCCVSEQVSAAGRTYRVLWAGSLIAPTSGSYTMSLQSDGEAVLSIDGRDVVRSNRPEPFVNAAVELTAGTHRVELVFQGTGPGAIEWAWTPPGGRMSIVPPSALRPAQNGVISPALPPSLFDPGRTDREESPLDLTP